MAFDEGLADRVRDAFEDLDTEVVERRMFGGLAFMVGGHMTAGVLARDLMVRVGPEAYEDALATDGARPMDLTGRPMRGIVFVAAASLDEQTLATWIRRGLTFTRSLPPK